MTCSVIIPCHPSNSKTLDRMLASIDVAARGLDLERIVIEDAASRGPSWARNVGLSRATGDVVFFCDADDIVRPMFFRASLSALMRTNAEICIFGFNDVLPRQEYDLMSNAALRTVFLPKIFGYSMQDVRRWNQGERLWDTREFASVWRYAFRRDFLVRHNLRFDETVRFCEDAMFLAECAVRCERMTSLRESLYDYYNSKNGLLARSRHSEAYWCYKFQMLQFRKRLDHEFGNLWQYCAGSAVFSALELLKAHRDYRRYVQDELVRESIREFPLSWRHPLVALGVVYLAKL